MTKIKNLKVSRDQRDLLQQQKEGKILTIENTKGSSKRYVDN